MDPILRQLLDERSIIDVCIRYATAIDDRDWDRLSSCFLPDAVAVYHADRPLVGYEAIEQAVRTAVTPLSRTQHLVGNFTVVLDGDEASSRCYLHAQHVKTGTPGGELPQHLGDDHISVYVPTTPNPTSGFFLMMPKSEVVELGMSVDEALKYVISMGVVAPEFPPKVVSLNKPAGGPRARSASDS